MTVSMMQHAKALYVDFRSFLTKHRHYTRIHYTPTPVTLENILFYSCVVANILIMLHAIVQTNHSHARLPIVCIHAAVICN